MRAKPLICNPRLDKRRLGEIETCSSVSGLALKPLLLWEIDKGAIESISTIAKRRLSEPPSEGTLGRRVITWALSAKEPSLLWIRSRRSMPSEALCCESEEYSEAEFELEESDLLKCEGDSVAALAWWS